MHRGHIEHLLASAGLEVRVLRDVERRLAAQTAPKFSIFDFLRTDEMGLSHCIAALLDPAGTHGQGSSYLELFMHALGCPPDWCDKLPEATVRTEARANGARRFDIEICLPGPRSIVIENKPWAADQELQLSDYAQQLQKTCMDGGWKLVYLGQAGPSERSISRQDQQRYQNDASLQVMGFGQLAAWLAQCALRTKPAAVRLFIEHLERYVRTTICGEADMQEAEAVKDIMLASQDNLRAALIVGSTIEDVKRQLLVERLKEPLRQALGETFFWEDSAISAKTRFAGFGIRPLGHVPGYLRFQFEGSDWRGFFWGIKRSQDIGAGGTGHSEERALVSTLEKQFGKGESGNSWFWCTDNLDYLGRYGGHALPKNWQNNEVPWLAMQSGSLHEGFVQLVKEVTMLLSQSAARGILNT